MAGRLQRNTIPGWLGSVRFSPQAIQMDEREVTPLSQLPRDA